MSHEGASHERLCHMFCRMMAAFLRVLPTRWRRGRFAYKMAASLEGFTHKMAACEFWLQDGGVSDSFSHKMAAREICLQDGVVSESFTHKMAAWENCLQDGGNAKQTKRKQKQRRICITFTV